MYILIASPIASLLRAGCWGLVLERVYYGPHRNALLVFWVG